MTHPATLDDPLACWGWTRDRDAAWDELLARWPDARRGRVVSDHGHLCHVVLSDERVVASVPGRILAERSNCPVAGDWVGVVQSAGGASIAELLPRTSLLRRQAAGEAVLPQSLAANVDLVAVTTSLNRDLNLRRIERYLAMIRAGGSVPLLVLTKADLVDDIDARLLEVRSVADGAPVIVVSAVSGAGVDALIERLGPGRTIAFVGSSGTGKSTLVNHLASRDVMVTQAIRENDDRGKHTTSHRQLVLLDGERGVLLDTPGLREVLPWIEPEEALRAFPDVAAAAEGCHFRDCAHGDERGCAVREASESGALPAARVDAWRKLQRELSALAERRKIRTVRARRR